MKKLLFICIAAAFTSCADAQKLKEADVPAAVKTTFEKQYPGAKAEWEKEGTNYEAEFDYNKEEMSVVIDAAGNIIETEVVIDKGKLPAAVLTYVQSHYAGKDIKEAAKITDAKGTVTYEAEIKGMDLLFDSTGTFIKEVKKDKEDDKD